MGKRGLQELVELAGIFYREAVGFGNEETGSTAESTCGLQGSLPWLLVQTWPFYS